MSDDRPKRDTMSLEEATVSNMWEIAAIVEVPNERDSARTKTSTTSSPNSAAESPCHDS